MKIRRRIATFIFSFIMLRSICAISALAYSERTINAANNTLHLYGYLDFLEGPLTIKDKVWYNANIYGTYDMTGIMTNASHGDNQCCYVMPGTDNVTLNKEFMYDTKRSVTSGTNGVYVGYGGTQGKMIMNAMGTKSTLYATE